MNELEKFLKSSLLESLLEARSDEYETLYIKEFNETENNVGDAEQELLDELKKIIPDENNRRKIRKKLMSLKIVFFMIMK